MASKTEITAAVKELAGSFSGSLLLPDNDGYDEARRVHNGYVDKRPALVARCRGAADVAAAVHLGRTHGLELAVRGGGHNVAGRATVDAGLMIDLSLMRGVHVDPVARLAHAEGGSSWKGYNRETQVHGLASPGGVVGSTGVAGLTLGGGFGWLTPKYGMALDNLVAIDMVLADGRVVRTSAEQDPDLFWATRGGGGNFGVATHFTFRLHPVGPMVTGGLVAWPFERAKDVLRFFRDFTATLPDEMFAVAALLTGPDGATKLVAVAAGHCGPAAAGAAAVKPVKDFGSPALDQMGPIPYEALNGMLDAAFPKGARNYWKSHFLDSLADQAIDTMVERFAACPTPMGQILFEHFHGAGTRVPVSDTAFAMRGVGFNALVLGEWLDPAHDEPCIRWTRETFAALQPFVGERRYLNYLAADDPADRALAAAYGPNIERLRALKKRYDPGNVFHLNVNIPPA